MFEWYEWIFITIIAIMVLLFLEGIINNFIKYLIIKNQGKYKQ